MEKVNRYKSIVRAVQEEIASLDARPEDPIKTKIIQDDLHGNYLLYSNGWEDESRVYGGYFHVEVTYDGKVWLHHDGTDLVVAEMLEERGIPKKDIVLAFYAPIRRPDTGYAVA